MALIIFFGFFLGIPFLMTILCLACAVTPVFYTPKTYLAQIGMSLAAAFGAWSSVILTYAFLDLAHNFGFQQELVILAISAAALLLGLITLLLYRWGHQRRTAKAQATSPAP